MTCSRARVGVRGSSPACLRSARRALEGLIESAGADELVDAFASLKGHAHSDVVWRQCVRIMKRLEAAEHP